MGKIIAKAWMTLDGVFDANSMGQWFNPFHNDERAEEITQNLMSSDAMLYGRTTYEMLMPYWSPLKNNEMGIADKINNAPKYIVSSGMTKADWNNSHIISENIIEQITALKKKYQQVLIDGSATLVESLTTTGLVDEYRLLVHPFVMGTGKHFFKDGSASLQLHLIKSKTFSNGVQLLHYATV